MSIKLKSLLLGSLLFVGMNPIVQGHAAEHAMDSMQHQHRMSSVDDGRVSLGLPPHMKQHQLSNMRSHLEAVTAIIGLIDAGKFEEASEIAHAKLGLTDEMKKMCNMFGNAEFTQLGLAFHQSGDALGDALLTKDVGQSLRALKNTMTYCTQCHATYRQ